MKKTSAFFVIIFLLSHISLFAQAPYPTEPTVENNSDEDIERYRKEKAAWIKENPVNDFPPGEERERYQRYLDQQKQYANQPEVKEEVIPPAPKKSEGPELKFSDIPSEVVKWKMIKIEVMENGEIDEKLDDYQQKLVNQITSNKLVIYTYGKKEFYVSRGNGVIKKFVAKTNNNKIILQIDNCSDCEAHQIELVQFDSDNLIAEKTCDGEAGKKFVIRLTYQLD